MGLSFGSFPVQLFKLCTLDASKSRIFPHFGPIEKNPNLLCIDTIILSSLVVGLRRSLQFFIIYCQAQATKNGHKSAFAMLKLYL